MISEPTARPTTGPTIDLSSIKQTAQTNLLHLLDQFEGTKTIVWDDKLIGPFEFVANANLLKQHEAIRLFRLSSAKPALMSGTNFILFFTRKDYQVAKNVADIIQRLEKSLLSKVSLVFVPQRCASIEELLTKKYKVDLDKLHSIEELPIEFFALDTDVFSMENESVFRDMCLNNDFSAVNQIVDGLVKLQELYGQMPKITGLGEAAKKVCDLLLKRRKLHPATNQISPQISQLVIIDRKVDVVTPLLTQLTYEGLLDEVFGIQHGTITLPSDKFANKETNQKDNKPIPPTKRFELRSSEELYARLRDCHINGVADALKLSAKNLQAEYEECNSEGKTIHEMGKIVKRLSHLKMAKNSQSSHVAIAELINEQTLKPELIYRLRIEHELLQEDRVNRVIPDIETKLLRMEPPLSIIKLICLQSIINNGLRPKISETYKHEIIQNYGSDYLLFLMQLEEAKLLLSAEKFYETCTFGQLRSKFNLINDNVDECNPNHLSYVYGGYSPLSIMVVKTLCQYGQGPQWRLLSESLKLIPEPLIVHSDVSSAAQGPVLPTNQSSSDSGYALRNLSAVASAVSMLASNTTSAMGMARMRRNSASSSQSSSEDSRTVLVFFIGGCTFAEISALRFVSQQEENNCDFIVGTTKIINGNTFLKSLWPPIKPL